MPATPATTEPVRLTPADRASMLAMSFHSLEDAPGVMPWDPEKLERWALRASSGERQAAAFVLLVWNAHHEWRVKFDLVHAVGNWDQQHLAAFALWVARPFFL